MFSFTQAVCAACTNVYVHPVCVRKLPGWYSLTTSLAEKDTQGAFSFIIFFGNTSYLGGCLCPLHLFVLMEAGTAVSSHVNVYEKTVIEVIPLVF